MALETPPSGLSTVTGIVPGAAMSAARIFARSWVADTKVVERSEPFHRTFAPETKLLPLTVRVKAAPPAVAEEGLRPVTVGAGPHTSKFMALETPPSGLSTVTGTVAGVAMSAAVIFARNWVADTKVVVRSAPFHRTFAPETKLLPLTVRVKAAPPAVAEEGLRPVTVGAGPHTTKFMALETPPSGLSTVTGTVAGAAMSAAVIFARNWVADTKVVVRSEPFQRTLAPETKLLPYTVRVKAGPPAVATEGLRSATVGGRTRTSKFTGLEGRPSGL